MVDTEVAVTVIVPVRDGGPTLARCLDAIAAQRPAVPLELVVVDNGSTDGSAELARRHPAVSRVIDERRPGSYAARNAGITASAGAVLAFTDADCAPQPDWLVQGLAVVSGGADLVGGAVEQRTSDDPGRWERYDRAVYLRQGELVEHEGFAATANLFVRRAVFDAVGPFDAGLRSSGDYEFCRRAVAAGYRLAFAGEARVAHEPRTTLVGTWRLHRRLGAGWAVLARTGRRPAPLHDPALRLPLGAVIDQASADGVRLRRREVAPAHVVAMAARWTGRLTGRP